MKKIIQGDSLQKLKELEENSIDAIITDPPYELGFMGKAWDNTGIANNIELWKECLRVLKPGGHLLAFSGTRTYHRMASAIEDAGFEVRDMIEWVYGSGFPKSLNIGKKVDELQGNEREAYERPDFVARSNKTPQRESQCISGEKGKYTKGTSEWEGWGTALKPAHEPICMARKPLSEKTVALNVLKYGTGGINIDESRVDVADNEKIKQEGHIRKGNVIGDERTSIAAGQFGDGAFVAGTDLTNGRFPANLLHDNSEEVRECFPETKGEIHNKKSTGNSMFMGDGVQGSKRGFSIKDNGNASRFFKSIIYQAKASKSERNKGCEGLEEKPKIFNGKSDKPSTDMKDVEKRFTTLPKANNHPTVKPIALMEYLIKMVTPKGGIVLDPFAGSGSTLVAAKQNGFQYMGIEREEEYIKIIEARLK